MGTILRSRGLRKGLILCLLQVTGIPMNCSVKLQLSLFIKEVQGIGYVGRDGPAPSA